MSETCKIHTVFDDRCPFCEITTLQSKLTEMESVLVWCSESVWSMMRPDSGTQGRWFVLMNDSSHDYAPTLYEALKSAWEARDHEA